MSFPGEEFLLSIVEAEFLKLVVSEVQSAQNYVGQHLKDGVVKSDVLALLAQVQQLLQSATISATPPDA